MKKTVSDLCRIAGLILLVPGGQPSSVHARELQVDREAENSVVFFSEAPLDDFEGVTDRIDGYVYWTDAAESGTTSFENGEFHFEVALGALDTGIGLRNRDMREDYLETDVYPYVSFTGFIGETLSGPDSGYTISASGVFRLHGVARKRTIDARVIPVSGGYHVTSEFVVNLKDHNIKVPKLMFMKINENIELVIDFYLSEVE